MGDLSQIANIALWIGIVGVGLIVIAAVLIGIFISHA